MRNTFQKDVKANYLGNLEFLCHLMGVLVPFLPVDRPDEYILDAARDDKIPRQMSLLLKVDKPWWMEPLSFLSFSATCGHIANSGLAINEFRV
jgi:hypothetical protein